MLNPGSASLAARSRVLFRQELTGERACVFQSEFSKRPSPPAVSLPFYAPTWCGNPFLARAHFAARPSGDKTEVSYPLILSLLLLPCWHPGSVLLVILLAGIHFSGLASSLSGRF